MQKSLVLSTLRRKTMWQTIDGVCARVCVWRLQQWLQYSFTSTWQRLQEFILVSSCMLCTSRTETQRNKSKQQLFPSEPDEFMDTRWPAYSIKIMLIRDFQVLIPFNWFFFSRIAIPSLIPAFWVEITCVVRPKLDFGGQWRVLNGIYAFDVGLINPFIFLATLESWGSKSLTQLSQVKRKGTPWISHQSMTGPNYRNRQQFTPTIPPYSKFRITN